MLDRRKFPRLDEKWDVDYRTITSEEFREDPISVLTVNISGGGICFEADEEIAKGTMLALELNSEAFPSPIIALAKAAWCKRERKKEIYEVGAEFWWIGWKDSDAQNTVAEYISKQED